VRATVASLWSLVAAAAVVAENKRAHEPEAEGVELAWWQSSESARVRWTRGWAAVYMCLGLL